VRWLYATFRRGCEARKRHFRILPCLVTGQARRYTTTNARTISPTMFLKMIGVSELCIQTREGLTGQL
jgi:hypothetical protein